MKKNFSFLFALFLMFTGAMNVYADAYPFKITTDANNPELYAVKSGRGDAYWWTLNAADGTIVLSAYEYAPTQHWYFMEVTEGETTYLQLYPYAGEGKAMGYQDTAAGHTKVWAVDPTDASYDCRWIFDDNGGNAPYGLKVADGSIYLSNYGGAGYKYGFYGNGPSADGGTAMYIEPVSKNASVLYEALQASNIFELQKKYGLVQETSKYYCNAPQGNEGSIDALLDNTYSSYFHSAWQAAYGKNEKHYLQAEVSRPVNEFSFYFKKRHNNNNNRPVDMTILGSADGVNYTEIININSGFPTTEDQLDYLSANITAPEACKYFRFVINATNNNAMTNGYPFFTYSEFYIFPGGNTAYILDEFRAVKEAANNLLAAEEGTYAFTSAKNAFNKAKANYDEVVALMSSNDLFTPVKNESTLAVGKRYIVVAAESGVAMAAPRVGGATPYRLATSVKEMNGFVETACAVAEGDELPYMVELVAAENGWLLRDVVNGKYLLWEEKRSLDLTNNMSKASVFEISINEDGEAVIKLAGENRTIRYGAEDERFACYTTGQEAVKLYEDATANDFLVAYAEMGELFNTCQSLWMISAVNEKAMLVAEAVEAINAAGVVSCSNDDLNTAIAVMSELVSYAWAMDAKYAEFKEALFACYDLQDNSKAAAKVAAVFAAVVEKYQAYQWSVPATTTADFDAYIAELNEAARAYALKAAPADGFTFDNIAVESEWNGTALGKSLTGHLYNPAAKAFLTTANSWGTQASILPNGYKWTVSTETVCDFEWLFDGAEDVCAANVGGVSLVPHKWVGNKQAPVPFAEGEDNGIVETTDGIVLPKTTSLFLKLNEEANLANYTIVYDVKFADAWNFTSLYQTTLDNNDADGEIFIAKNMIGINHKGVGYAGTIEADTWHKIAVVGNEGFVTVYVDGIRVVGSTGADDRWIIKKDGLFFFLDNDGETTDGVELAGIQLWKKSLDEVAIAQMSGVKEIPGEAIPARTAKWTFDNADNLYASEVGSMTLSPRMTGANNTVPTEFPTDSTGVVKTEEGIAIDKMTCLFMGLNEAADLTNYTLVWDVKAADVTSGYLSLYQTDLTNNNDGDLFINNNKFGLNTSGLAYNGRLEADTWYRLAAVVRNGYMNVYVNGERVGTSTSANAVWTINKEGVYFFLDESGEHKSLEVGGIQFWNSALSDAHVKAMGAAFAEDGPVTVTVPEAAATTYTVSGPLVHPSSADKHYLNNGYADGLAEAHTFTLVAKNTYAIQDSNGKYYAYKEGTTVVQKVNEMDENCYWQFVTEDEFLSKFADASYENPANATFAVPCQNFGYNNAEIKLWSGEPNVGGDYADYVAYKQNVETCDISTVISNMPYGVYRLKVQGFYRQGTTEEATAARQNNAEIHPAKFYANDASVTVMSIIDEAGNNTTSTHGVAFGEYGKAPYSNNDAGVYFRLGLYEHEILFYVEEGEDIKIGLAKDGGVANDWVTMDNVRLEYLGTDKSIIDAVEEIEASENGEVASRAYYTLGGVPVDAPVQGVNIVKVTYTNGQVEYQKVLVK